MALQPKTAKDIVDQDGIKDASDAMLVIVSDPAIPEGPSKKSAVISVAGIRGTVGSVIVNEENTPYQASTGQTIYIDNRDTNDLEVLLPADPEAGKSPISFYPLGDSTVHPWKVNAGEQKVDGGVDPEVLINANNVFFQTRWLDVNYGWGFFSMGANYVIQNVAITGSDLSDLRMESATTINLVLTDREKGVGTTSDIAGTIMLPPASSIPAGWQTSVFQLGDGVFTFASEDDEIIAFEDQKQTLGKGAFVTVLMLPTGAWLIGGGLTLG